MNALSKEKIAELRELRARCPAFTSMEPHTERVIVNALPGLLDRLEELERERDLRSRNTALVRAEGGCWFYAPCPKCVQWKCGARYGDTLIGIAGFRKWARTAVLIKRGPNETGN